MKIRNMLRGIPLLLFMMLGLSVFLNCGPLNRNPMPVPVASHTVTFDAQGGTPQPNPVQVEHGKKVTKPADPAKASFIFGGWYKEKEYKMPWNFQTDTVTANITLYAKWNEKGASIAIQFDASKMTCQKRDGTDITPGATVQEHDELNFEARPSSGKIVDKWTVNGVAKDDETRPSFMYQVQAKDAQSGTITISYTEKQPAQVTIQFDPSKMICRKGGSVITPGATVQEHDELNFEARPSSGKIVDKWTVNGVAKDDETHSWFTYPVQAKDAQSGTITISYTEKQPGQVTIQFDASKMTCYTRGGTAITPGALVQEHDELGFEATPSSGKIVDKWSVNGVEREYETRPWFNYQVQAKDVQSGTITVSYTEKQPVQVIIQFDASKMTCRKRDGSATITPGTTVQEKDDLFFNATLSSGKTVDKWSVNGVEKEYATEPGFGYEVRAEDAQSGTITISYTEKQAAQAAIQFDASKMTCRKRDGSATITPGTTVQENDRLYFEAMPSSGKTVDKWTVNGVDAGYEGRRDFHYTVRAEDAQSGTITIAYTEKQAAQATIQFDASKMTCRKRASSATITPGTTVQENDQLYFEATPSAGKLVDKWSVNGVDAGYEGRRDFHYTVRAEDAQSGTITISYTEKQAAQAAIQFDASKMTCRKNSSPDSITPGTTVQENDRLEFTATPSAGKLVDKWSVNGVEKEHATRPWFNYQVRAEDVQSSMITVAYTEKQAAQVAIQFDASKMTCRKDGSTTITPGTTVQENDWLHFEATPSSGKTVDKWSVNGVEREHATEPGFGYRVRAEDAQSGTITVAYTEKQPAQATIQFDASKMTCWKNGTAITPGTTVQENDWLHFEATPSAGKLVDKWSVNGVEKEHATRPWFNYQVRAEDVQSSMITVAYTEKQAAQVAIQFDASKMTCRKDGSTTITPGTTVQENDWLHFEATPSSGKTVDKWSVNGVEREHATEPGFGYRVRAEDAQSGTITVAYTEKQPAQATIQFDASKMTCWKNGTAITPGTTVQENDWLHFEATPSSGKTVDKWSVNGVEKEHATEPGFGYRVRAEDVRSGTITISYTEKQPAQAAIQFDASKMTCRKSDGTAITPGVTIQENDWLHFEATPSSGKTVDKWSVNGVEREHETQSWFGYRVLAKDTQSGMITISYTEK